MTQSTAQTGNELQTNGSHAAPGAGVDASTAEIERIFKLQRANQYAVAETTTAERKAKLKE